MMAGGQKEKCVTNVETTQENNTVGVNGREERLIRMRITNPRHTPLLTLQGSALVCIVCMGMCVCEHVSIVDLRRLPFKVPQNLVLNHAVSFTP